MVSHQWRRFPFFSKELVRETTSEAWLDFKNVDIACSSSGKGRIVLGDNNGNVYFIYQNLKIEKKQMYLTRVNHVVQVSKQNILITVGEDEPGHPVLRVWTIGTSLMDSNNVRYYDLVTLIALLDKSTSSTPCNVTCLCVSDNLSNIAIGTASGTVWLSYRHDITRDQRFKALHTDKAAITGLAFSKENALFVATESAVYSYRGVSEREPEVQFLSEEGCGIGLSLLTDHHQYNQFLIAPKNKFLFFTVDGPGQNLPMDGTRSHVAWYRGYLVSVSYTRKTMSKQDSICDLTVYDMKNKFIGFTGTFPPIKALLVEWGSLNIIGSNNELYILKEKDIQDKIDILKRKCLYDDAIQLAKNNRDENMHVNLIKGYGDHLANKGNHNAAISKYIETIGSVEPSYVIRKFLDARRIHNLTQYLEALHEKGEANQEHTTLLLNCYTKVKNVEKLQSFIRSEGELNFDVEIAIKVCRQAGYFDEAAFLAKKYEQYDWYVHIQIEDKHQYETALEYIEDMPFDKQKENVKNFGKQLIDNLPPAMTEFLKKLTNNESDLAETFIPLFVNKNEYLIDYLEAVIENNPDVSSQVYNTLLELYLRDTQTADLRDKRIMQIKDMLKSESSHYTTDHALVLLELYHVQEGLVIIYEKLGLYQQMLDCYMNSHDYDSIMSLCSRHGSLDPSLWIKSLKYFAVQNDTASEKNVKELLNCIENYNILPPLMIVRTLCEDTSTPISVIMNYLTRHLKLEEEQANENKELINKYSVEAKAIRSEIHKLRTEPVVFQNIKCTKCGRKLNLPAVHLLCKHSWHQQCFEGLADLDEDCPVCVNENRQVLEHLKSLQQIENLDEQFFRSIDMSQDGFTAVADFFAKGVFNKPVVIDNTLKKSAPSTTQRKRPSQSDINQRIAQVTKERTSTQKNVILPEYNPFTALPEDTNPFTSPTTENNPFSESYEDKNPFEGESNPFASDGNPFSNDGNPFTDNSDGGSPVEILS